MTQCCTGGDLLAQKRVTLQKPNPTATPDASGHVDLSQDVNWTTVKAVYGTPKTRGGRENFLFNQVQAEVSSIWDFKYSGVTKQIEPTWRLALGTRRLNISAVFDVDERREIIRCYCIEGK